MVCLLGTRTQREITVHKQASYTFKGAVSYQGVELNRTLRRALLGTAIGGAGGAGLGYLKAKSLEASPEETKKLMLRSGLSFGLNGALYGGMHGLGDDLRDHLHKHDSGHFGGYEGYYRRQGQEPPKPGAPGGKSGFTPDPLSRQAAQVASSWNDSIHGTKLKNVWDAGVRELKTDAHHSAAKAFMSQVGKQGANVAELQKHIDTMPDGSAIKGVMNVLLNKHHGSPKTAAVLETCMLFDLNPAIFAAR